MELTSAVTKNSNEIASLKIIIQQNKGGFESVCAVTPKQLEEKYGYVIPFKIIHNFENFDKDLEANKFLRKDVVSLFKIPLMNLH